MPVSHFIFDKKDFYFVAMMVCFKARSDKKEGPRMWIINSKIAPKKVASFLMRSLFIVGPQLSRQTLTTNLSENEAKKLFLGTETMTRIPPSPQMWMMLMRPEDKMPDHL